MPVALLGLLALATLAACSGAPCVRHSDCDPGLVCSPAGACLVVSDPSGDAGADASDAADAGAASDAADDAGDAADAAGDATLDAAVDAAVDAAPPRYAIPDQPPVALPQAHLTPPGDP
jgi:hypothetical protein